MSLYPFTDSRAQWCPFCERVHVPATVCPPEPPTIATNTTTDLCDYEHIIVDTLGGWRCRICGQPFVRK